MAKNKEYPYKHRHIAIKHGYATFYSEDEPSKELLDALNKMAELAYEQCAEVKVDTDSAQLTMPVVSKRSELLVCCGNCKNDTHIGCFNKKCENYSEFTPTH